MRLGDDGTLVWAKTYGGTGPDALNCLVYHSSGNIISCGLTQSAGAGEYDCFVLSIDEDGLINWASVCGTSRLDRFYSITEGAENSLFLSGTYTPGATSHTDMIIAKYSESGAFQWCTDGGGSNYDELYSITVQSDNNLAACGYTRSFGACSDDCIAIRLSPTGSLLESYTYGGADREDANDIIETSSRNYMISGRSRSFSTGDYDNFIINTFDDLSSCCGEEIDIEFSTFPMSSVSALPDIGASDFTPTLIWNTGYFIDIEQDFVIVCP